MNINNKYKEGDIIFFGHERYRYRAKIVQMPHRIGFIRVQLQQKKTIKFLDDLEKPIFTYKAYRYFHIREKHITRRYE